MSKIKQYKLSRRLGTPLFEKCQSPKYVLSITKKDRNIKFSRRPKARSEYGLQLIEKQKVRYLYGISESQMQKYVKESGRTSRGGGHHEAFIDLLERRIDNVVYRSGLASTRRMARQLVSHGHFTHNNIKVRVPSILVRVGDNIKVRDGSKTAKVFSIVNKNMTERSAPKWLKPSPKTLEVSVTDKVIVDKAELVFDTAKVFEYYSR